MHKLNKSRKRLMTVPEDFLKPQEFVLNWKKESHAHCSAATNEVERYCERQADTARKEFRAGVDLKARNDAIVKVSSDRSTDMKATNYNTRLLNNRKSARAAKVYKMVFSHELSRLAQCLENAKLDSPVEFGSTNKKTTQDVSKIISYHVALEREKVELQGEIDEYDREIKKTNEHVRRLMNIHTNQQSKDMQHENGKYLIGQGLPSATSFGKANISDGDNLYAAENIGDCDINNVDFESNGLNEVDLNDGLHDTHVGFATRNNQNTTNSFNSIVNHNSPKCESINENDNSSGIDRLAATGEKSRSPDDAMHKMDFNGKHNINPLACNDTEDGNNNDNVEAGDLPFSPNDYSEYSDVNRRKKGSADVCKSDQGVGAFDEEQINYFHCLTPRFLSPIDNASVENQTYSSEASICPYYLNCNNLHASKDDISKSYKDSSFRGRKTNDTSGNEL